ncbi:MAG TPA: TetR/AcrR family transcriptional regulator [Phototrophicaceae bacterium]|nr:TetR/AcrR family transcriptional regulator [Phototrophicaceae bacterium]
MPKPTFFNLAEEKRKAILEIAIKEFAENDYQSASISRMVARLGIAKGSFYQYFEDKRDLYFHLLDLVMQERLAFMQQPSTPDLHEGFFQYAQWLLEMGLRYDFAHPRLGQILYRALFGSGPFHDESLGQIKTSLLAYQRQMLALGVSLGEIDPTLDLEVAAHLLNAIMTDFSGLIVTRLQLDTERLKQGDYSQLDSPKLRELSAEVIKIVQYGLAKRSG